MGKVSTRKRGQKWQYYFEIASIGGKRQWETGSGFRTKSEALEAGNAAYNNYKQSGLSFKPSEISVSDYLDYYYDTYCKTNLKDTTLQNYEKHIRLHLKPALGRFELKSITPAICQQFINDIFNQGFSKNSRQTMKGILNKSFDYAVEPLQFIRSNPMKSVRNPLPEATPEKPARHKKKEYVTPEQWQKLIERFPERHSCHVPLMLAYHCGLRLGEIFALTWDDINLEKKELSVNHQIQMYNSGFWTFAAPKYKSYRTITMGSEMAALLEREKERQDKARAYYEEHYCRNYINAKGQLLREVPAAEVTEDMKEVFMVNVREDGTYCQPRITQHLGRIVHYELGMPVFDMHSLRHTHCSVLLTKGAPTKYVQTRLGHKNIETTLNIYTHLTEDMKKEGDNILEDL